MGTFLATGQAPDSAIVSEMCGPGRVYPGHDTGGTTPLLAHYFNADADKPGHDGGAAAGSIRPLAVPCRQPEDTAWSRQDADPVGTICPAARRASLPATRHHRLSSGSRHR